jgi:glutathione S-transferase
VLDSWLIAEYLDATYPDRPMLFEGPSMKVLTKFIDAWLWRTAISPWFSCYMSMPSKRCSVPPTARSPAPATA